ncbi:MAG: DotA/TraY family protein [Bdellovibrionales bacterium]
MRTSYSRLKFTKEGIPQIVLFCAGFGCLFLGAMFILTLLLSVFIGQAHAADTTSETTSLFESPFASGGTDWALNWINYLFSGTAIREGSQKVAQPSSCEVQNALGACLSTYSSAILILAGFLLIYHLVAMVAEQAHTGKLMGKAHQIWAPIRLAFAIGMLVPLSTGNAASTSCNGSVTGYNTAQYMMVKVAKWGSGLASTVWKDFIVALKDQELPGCTVADSSSATCLLPNPDYKKIVRVLMSMDACSYLFNHYIANYNYVSYAHSDDKAFFMPRLSDLEFSIDKADGAFLGVKILHAARASYRDFYNKDKDRLCGGYIAPAYTSSEYDKVRSAQYLAIADVASDIAGDTEDLVAPYLTNSGTEEMNQDELKSYVDSYVSSLAANTKERVYEALNEADQEVQQNLTQELGGNGDLASGGWLTAPSWFSTVIRIQSVRSASVFKSQPTFVYPAVFNLAKKERPEVKPQGYWSRYASDYIKQERRENSNVYLTPSRVAFALSNYMDAVDASVNDYSASGSADASDTHGYKYLDEQKNELIASGGGSVINHFLSQLDAKLTEDTGVWQDGVIGLKFGVTSNPMAELAAFGQKCVNYALYIMAGGAVATGASAASDVLAKVPYVGKIFSVFSSEFLLLASFAFAVGMILFTIGFTLGYVVPLYPFYRFFFGSLQWIMTVMEAIVLAPLFALAHIEPQGEGLAGKRGGYGYAVLMQLILRPVLMVFGLIVGHLLFIVTLAFLNEAFVFAAKGTGAFTQGMPPIGKIVYTAIYAGIVLILANQCYSTIGLFPQVALRWLGIGQVQEERIQDTSKIITAVAAGTAAHLSGKIPEASNRYLQHHQQRQVDATKQKTKADNKAIREDDRRLWGNINESLLPNGGQPSPSGTLAGGQPSGTPVPPLSGAVPPTSSQPPELPDTKSGKLSPQDALLAKQDMQSDPEYLAMDREAQRRRQGQQSAEGPKEDYSQLSPPSSGETAQADYNPNLPPPEQTPSQPPKEPDPKTKKQQEEWLAKTDGGKKKPDDWNSGA